MTLSERTRPRPLESRTHTRADREAVGLRRELRAARRRDRAGVALRLVATGAAIAASLAALVCFLLVR